MARVRLDHYQDDTVLAGGTDVHVFPIVPNGETWVIERFGGALRAKGIVALQQNTGTGWFTIRALTTTDEYQINRGYVGDGTLQFRIVRIEESAIDQDIVSWIEGYKR